jgi:DNA-binding MarR family transcriptional regulator
VNEGGGFLLGVAARLSERSFGALLREGGLGDLEAGQGRIVYLLWQGGQTSQTELGRLSGLDKSSLALNLRRLEARGYATRKPDPSDGRRFLVSPGPSVRKALRIFSAMSTAMETRFYKGFSARDRKAFEGYLRRIIANLGEA